MHAQNWATLILQSIPKVGNVFSQWMFRYIDQKKSNIEHRSGICVNIPSNACNDKARTTKHWYWVISINKYLSQEYTIFHVLYYCLRSCTSLEIGWCLVSSIQMVTLWLLCIKYLHKKFYLKWWICCNWKNSMKTF